MNERTLLIVIEGPPPRKNDKHKVYADAGGIGRRKSASYKDFRERTHAAWCVLRAKGARPFGALAPLRVSITAYWGRMLGDIDAPVESTLDALTFAGVWYDDGQVEELDRVRRARDPKRPRVEVEIVELEGVRP
jgi:Holliday junction resolvase RusA-like endonuclease